MTKLSRRHFLSAALLSGCATRPVSTGCGSLKGQAIRWIVPFAPGGGNDFYSRIVSSAMAKILGAEITIDHQPGGGSMVGLIKLRDARPDGRTLGTVNVPGALAASVAGQDQYPSPANDFTILGRVLRARPLVATGEGSPIRTIEDLFDIQKRRPILAGVTGVSSSNFLFITITAWLLGLRIEYVAGFNGSVDTQLAVMRGDVDVVANGYENLVSGVEQGDLRYLLQISDSAIRNEPALENVAWLGGPQGLASSRAVSLGRDPEEAIRNAATLVAVGDGGTVIAGPRGLPAELKTCLRSVFHEAIRDPGLNATAQATGRVLDPATGAEAENTIARAAGNVAPFAVVLREAMARMHR